MREAQQTPRNNFRRGFRPFFIRPVVFFIGYPISDGFYRPGAYVPAERQDMTMRLPQSLVAILYLLYSLIVKGRLVMSTKHQILFTEIQNKILSGEWTNNTIIPTENELCKIYSVSRITVRRSMDDLERIGLIERIQGKGSIVRHMAKNSGEDQIGFTQHLRDMGIIVKNRLLKKELVQGPMDIRLKLRLSVKTNEKIWHFSRLRLIKGKPVVFMDTYTPLEIGNRMQDYDLEKESFYYLYKEILGKTALRADSTVTAVIPSHEICDLLHIEYNSAHLLHKSIAYLESDKPVEVSYSVFNANLYEFSLNINNVRIMRTP
jgi:DNA-binding GntR family transcriptional regulator